MSKEPDKMEVTFETECNGLPQVAWNIIACANAPVNPYKIDSDLVGIAQKYLSNLLHTRLNKMSSVDGYEHMKIEHTSFDEDKIRIDRNEK